MDTLKSPSELWRKLQSDAGLEIRRRNGTPGRDADVEEALKVALGLRVDGTPLNSLLVADAASPAPQVSIETLLVALLTSQQGYTAMMRDMLDLLISADAARDGQTLGIQFRFDEVSDPIRFTLEEFRATVERFEKVLVSRVELPRADGLWDLHRELREMVEYRPSGAWPADFPPVLPAPITGFAALDAAFKVIIQLVMEFREMCRSFGPTRNEALNAANKRHPDLRDPAQEDVRRRIGAAHDYWDASVLEILQQVAQRVTDHSLSADDVASKLEPLLASIGCRQDWVDRTYTELLDLLHLPTWRKRHELFSVWVGSVLLRTAQTHADAFHFHSANGVLSFAFGGSRLATYERDGEQFDIWAELRSALVGRSTKRKKGIQPDFRVLRPGLATSHNATTRLVLECKHYLTPSISNFSQAAMDYARSCPNSAVLVVNHGPVDDTALMASIDPSLRLRTQFIGDATVYNERHTARLSNVVRSTLFPPQPASSRGQPAANTTPLASGIAASICLRWDETLHDVDLALEIHERGGTIQRVDFRERGDLAIAPYARLDRDQQEGPGEERIDIDTWYAERYVLVATNYTGTGELGPGHLDCTITLPTGDTVLNCPPLAGETEWRITAIVVTNGVARLEPLG